MTKETIDTTNKLIRPEDVAESDNDVIRQLSENLQGVTAEDVGAMCDEMDESERRKEEEKKSGEIPQELKDFRKKWEQEIDLDDSIKKKIVDAVNQIPHRATIEPDGSRLVEFELGGKRYKCLDVNIVKYSDSEYLDSEQYERQTKNEVKGRGMWFDNTSYRDNEKLKEYVEEEKNNRKMEIPAVEFQIDLINELGDKAGLSNESDKIAMWMYLTGNYGHYWLRAGGHRKSDRSSESRSSLRCHNYRAFECEADYMSGSLCLISCEGDDRDETAHQTNTEQDMIDFFSRVNADQHTYY